VNKMKKENENARDSVAAIGIGAMIVFIALVLVAAVASAVIIQTGEKLQQNAQQTGSDVQQEIGGKITIITAWVGDDDPDADGATSDEEITLVFEPAAGSEPLLATSVAWNIVCGDAAIVETVGGDFSDATDLAGGAETTFNQGNVYMINLVVGDENSWDTVTPASECIPTQGEEHVLMIMVDGGGSTYETLSYTDEAQGASIV